MTIMDSRIPYSMSHLNIASPTHASIANKRRNDDVESWKPPARGYEAYLHCYARSSLICELGLCFGKSPILALAKDCCVAEL